MLSYGPLILNLPYVWPGVMKGSSTSLIAVPGVYTGSYESQFPPLKATYNTFVADYLQVSPDSIPERTTTPGCPGAMQNLLWKILH
jgi:hypothetical protein